MSLEPFKMTCVVWIAEHAHAAVGGTITFDKATGLTIDLVGSLDPAEPLASVFDPPEEDEAAFQVGDDEPRSSLDPGSLVPVVLGVVPGTEITLLNVLRSEASAGMPGHAHEILQPELLIRGAHLLDGFETPMREVAVHFDVLPGWYDTARAVPAKVEMSQHGPGHFTVQWRTPEPLRAKAATGDVIELSLRSRRHLGPRQVSVSAEPQFTVKFAAPTTLRNAVEAVTPLRWLVSLLTRRPARITRLDCTGDGVPGGVELVFEAQEPSGPLAPVHPYAVALRMDQFDVADAVPRWMDAAERLRTPLALMFANWFSSGLYAENRLLNAAAAAESLNARLYGKQRTDLGHVQEAAEAFIAAFPEDERTLLRQRIAHLNEPSLRGRLRRLAGDAQAAFGLVVKDVDVWAGAVVRARNEVVHGTRLSNGGPRLRALAESIEHLVEAHLLMQLGLTPDAVAEALRETPRTTWISRLVNRYVPEAGLSSDGNKA